VCSPASWTVHRANSVWQRPKTRYQCPGRNSDLSSAIRPTPPCRGTGSATSAHPDQKSIDRCPDCSMRSARPSPVYGFGMSSATAGGPPVHRGDRERRSLARTDPAGRGKSAWVSESVRLHATVGDLQHVSRQSFIGSMYRVLRQSKTGRTITSAPHDGLAISGLSGSATCCDRQRLGPRCLPRHRGWTCAGRGTSRAIVLRILDRYPLALVGSLVLGLQCSCVRARHRCRGASVFKMRDVSRHK
jgi:hypothetical protein